MSPLALVRLSKMMETVIEAVREGELDVRYL